MRGASADTQPQPETSVADQPEGTRSARTAHPGKEKADKDRLERRAEPARSPPSPKEKAKRRKTLAKKDSGKRKRPESSSKPQASSGEYSSARLPAMQPTLSGNEILTRAALQLAADWDIDHPRSEEGVRSMAMEQMAIGARVRSLCEVIHKFCPATFFFFK